LKLFVLEFYNIEHNYQTICCPPLYMNVLRGTWAPEKAGQAYSIGRWEGPGKVYDRPHCDSENICSTCLLFIFTAQI